MSLVTRFEKNSMRRSYRTSIPLQVVLEGDTYNAIDWSLTGVALANIDKVYLPGEEVKAVLILPLYEATLTFPVTLLHEYTEEGRSGFSFVDLGEKNRNILRRFIELAIEGKVDRVDDIIAIYEEPQIDTPIQTPVTLQEDEAHALKNSFLRSAARYILFALFVAALAGVLLFYNFRYSYEGSGTVAGNELKIYPNVNAVVEKLFVKEGDRVTKETPLVTLDSSAITYKIALLEVEKKRKTEALLREQKSLRQKESGQTKLMEILRQKFTASATAYQNARKQYAAHLITKPELMHAENLFLDAKLQLEKLRALQKEELKKFDTETAGNTTEDIDVKLAYLKKRLSFYNIAAPSDAKVYEIYVTEGEEASKSRPLMMLWTADKPYIVAHVPNRYLSDIVKGTEVDIIDRNSNTTLHGKVYKTGSTEERGLQSDTFAVYIDPENLKQPLAPYQRVELLFKRAF